MDDKLKGVTPWDIKKGFVYQDRHSLIKVIAVADGYVMVRRPGAVPFVRSVSEVVIEANAEIIRNFTPKESA